MKEEKLKEVDFKIAKDAFEGPFTCCDKKTKKINKKLAYNDVEFNYDVWYCSKCRKEYVDSEQSKRLERFWAIRRLLDEKLISIERRMNHDGKTYFFRFPKELTKNWKKKGYVDIKLVTPETFLVEVKAI